METRETNEKEREKRQNECHTIITAGKLDELTNAFGKECRVARVACAIAASGARCRRRKIKAG